ncbi:MAG TPA: asparagine synthase (glutamine-hydrolyzing) [Methylomirabilota bacterium]|nr:asparagine synthase (glutamine-hydrolyzing) [Methylomirabilota bacterium]
MCGIAGVVDFDGRPVGASVLSRMIARIGYRGPDDTGVHTDGPVGLAHARLSIIDAAGGRQPMASRDGRLWIVFSGEIFNHVELREELRARGHAFATRSDTEVVLAAYADRGEACVRDFNGQWAFAVWDAGRRRLFLSRDRLGVRPLFYARAGRRLVFGSEIKALFAHPGVVRELDLDGLDEVFTFWCALAPRTVFRGVDALPPGHSMTVEATGAARVAPYWRPDYPAALEAERDPDAAALQLRALLADATRLRLRADVPVAAYLSGGLDSTVLSALITRVTDTPLRTFSVVFDDPEFDERHYQQHAARFLRSEHAEVRCSGSDIARVFPAVIRHAETPVLRTAPAPLYLLARRVHEQGYKVALTGEGADEMLGGYDIYKEAKIRRFWAAAPASRARPLLLRRLYPWLPSLQRQPEAYRRAFFHVTPEAAASPFFSHLPRWTLTASLKRFFAPAVRAALATRDVFAELRERLPARYGQWPPLCQAQYLETTGLLPGYILSSQGDRMAMAHAVELRSPFLDVRLVEFAAALPPTLKLRVLDEKHLLKRAAADLIPATIATRSKQPYRAPEGASFFDGAGEDYVSELLAPARVARDGVFDPAAVGRLVEKFRDGRAVGIKDNMALVGILSTQLLIHHFIASPLERAEHGTDPAGTASIRHR